jgi:hypothetical protein
MESGENRERRDRDRPARDDRGPGGDRDRARRGRRPPRGADEATPESEA